MDAHMEGGENGRSTEVVNGVQAIFTTSGSIFSDDEWTKLIRDLSLPPRQAEIVRLLFAGHSDKQIASELNRRVPTIRSHLSRLFSKFDARDRTELVLQIVRQFRGNSHVAGHRL